MRSKLLVSIAAIAAGCASPRRETPKSVTPSVPWITEREPVVIHLVHADAVEISLLFGDLLGASRRQSCCTLYKPELVNRTVREPDRRVVADARTNSLLLRDFEPNDLQSVRELIARLDVEP